MCSATTSTKRLPTRAFTLVELLVSATIAMAVMAALAGLFSIYGSSIRSAESVIAMTDAMRACGLKLREDLRGATADPARALSPESGSGYFEYVEGPRKDYNATEVPPTIQADTDDVLMLTVKSAQDAFTGRYLVTDSPQRIVTTAESPLAEVVWFCKASPASEQTVPGLTMNRLYRRQLLIQPYVGQYPFTALNSYNALANSSLPSAYIEYDLSLRQEGTSLVPNSLSDLTRREHRFFHGAAFPFAFLGTTASGLSFDGTTREGEDVVCTNVISFDVRVFDPEAPAHFANGLVVLPGDPGYPVALSAGSMQQDASTGDLSASGIPLAKGAYVDLGWGVATASTPGAPTVPFDITPALPNPQPAYDNRFPGSEDKNKNDKLDPGEDVNLNGRLDTFTAFQGLGMKVSQTVALSLPTFDTWSRHYEYNGRNEGTADSGVDGVDNWPDGSPDDRYERETSPPYPVPLRGVEVRLRCYDPVSNQVRQTTIRHSFIR